MYQRIGKVAYKADLSNTIKLVNELGNPEKGFRSIHVGGTNGKGSVSHMLASVLQAAGYKVGLYTSPHLIDFRERIKINGELISEDFVTSFIKKHKSFFETESLSFFEMTVGLAFDYFNAKKVDIAIIEVGMGGRLDSTNVIKPEVSVITNIGLDHTQFLGNSLAEIAFEKAGIIKAETPIVIGEKQVEIEAIFKKIAKDKETPIYFAEDDILIEYISDLKGDYQKKNKLTVLKTLKVLMQLDWIITEDQIREGLLQVVKNTGLQGRWQVLQEAPKIICDTAHNKDGLTIVMNQLANETYLNLYIVFGSVSDKNLEAILPLFPMNARYYFCKPSVARGMNVEYLKEQANKFGLYGEMYSSVNAALLAAKNNASPKDLIFIGGSTFVVAEIL